MITDERLSSALDYLAKTDVLAAECKADVCRKEYLCKRIRARKFLLANGGSVESRKATAEDSSEVATAETELANAIVAFEKVKARRATEELVTQVWRTLQANRRQGPL